MTNPQQGPWALISVSDKTGVVEFARSLVENGYGILSTGGTARAISDAGVAVTRVSEVTGFPEIMDGRVKTLHPLIHAALLGRRDVDSHLSAMREHGVPDIRIVAVNLYPFRETVARDGVTRAEAIENIDIGGPTMVRASAKNSEFITIVVDPADYPRIAGSLPDGPDRKTREDLAMKAFRHTASYDRAITDYLGGQNQRADLELSLIETESLRYGENPHQKAALYRTENARPHGGLTQLHGKSLSYNNIVDLDAAIELVAEFSEPAVTVVKHTNPAGCASATDIEDAFESALACDPMSAFGGIFSLNRKVTQKIAEKITEGFYEIVAAPGFEPSALEILQSKKNLRLLEVPLDRFHPGHVIRATTLGYLIQDSDPRVHLDRDDVEVATSRAPDDEEWDSLLFAWRVCKHVKSNAIVICEGTRTVGIGAGQMSRVDAVEIAVKKRRSTPDRQVLASDAFFPFRDGVDAAAEAGVRAIIQPGGSRNDPEVIEACDEHGITMVMTGKRHFRH